MEVPFKNCTHRDAYAQPTQVSKVPVVNRRQLQSCENADSQGTGAAIPAKKSKSVATRGTSTHLPTGHQESSTTSFDVLVQQTMDPTFSKSNAATSADSQSNPQPTIEFQKSSLE
ncbi:unnamed protein product [Acanthoscelides obtectus]|uniref:Uncharacterized protein n=1 Tax=Acanthoscelides obtectus TaxID=200917 RepID=A0A9P0LTJ8_ACAOB|nr:unnamed protein product [Acanthoscelides obtectus]CAK1627132.1 hypothetical protein AOBTE_LOCUS4329 [Acanthoscelides obtectus]